MNEITGVEMDKLKKIIFGSKKGEDRRKAYLNKTEENLDLNKVDSKGKTEVEAKLDTKESVTKKNREEIKKLLDAIYSESKVKNWDKDKQDARKETVEKFNKYEEVLRPFYPERAQFFKDWLAWKNDCDTPFMEMKDSELENIKTKKRISAVELTGKSAVFKDGESETNTNKVVSQAKIRNATLKIISGPINPYSYKFIFQNDPPLEPTMTDKVLNEKDNQ